eukprot:TRINITY_DN33407_c0_g1_i3.p1 TRINITY_DN33407_c0_g1~~TRINITY_DN33407_c0_g1_i3.p1  ORF type:complete len:245 (-),score=18.99 TRINITY_DN33407_c0_g1_i3:65-742(-)
MTAMRPSLDADTGGDGSIALSDVLRFVRELIMQHEPKCAALLLTKAADGLEKRGLTMSLTEWGEAVDDVACERRMGCKEVAVMQNALQKKVSSIKVGQIRPTPPPKANPGAKPQRVSAPTLRNGMGDQDLAGHKLTSLCSVLQKGFPNAAIARGIDEQALGGCVTSGGRSLPVSPGIFRAALAMTPDTICSNQDPDAGRSSFGSLSRHSRNSSPATERTHTVLPC